MDWQLILGVAAALFGGLNIFQFIFFRSTRKEFAAKADMADAAAEASVIGNYEKGINEWQDLYKEQRARNQELECKIEALSQENNELRLANQRLKIEIDRNSEDIRELKEIIKSLKQRKTAKQKQHGDDK